MWLLKAISCLWLGHEWGESVYVRDGSCDRQRTCQCCGATEERPVRHLWDESCEQKQICQRCGATGAPPLLRMFDFSTMNYVPVCLLRVSWAVVGAPHGRGWGEWLDNNTLDRLVPNLSRVLKQQGEGPARDGEVRGDKWSAVHYLVTQAERAGCSAAIYPNVHIGWGARSEPEIFGADYVIAVIVSSPGGNQPKTAVVEDAGSGASPLLLVPDISRMHS